MKRGVYRRKYGGLKSKRPVLPAPEALSPKVKFVFWEKLLDLSELVDKTVPVKGKGSIDNAATKHRKTDELLTGCKALVNIYS
jgi:hypothetical protein